MGNNNLAKKHNGESKSELSPEFSVVSLVHALSPSELVRPNLPIQLIPIEVVCEMLGLKRSATLEMVRKGILPKPIKFGTSRRSAARWVLHEICDFIFEKAAERNIVNASSRSTEVSK